MGNKIPSDKGPVNRGSVS
uniref:Uncharacterized protein n=1 Tax=Anguilla anguilla TaxID=7936 RepID=A0A0E9SAX1_ANGAN